MATVFVTILAAMVFLLMTPSLYIFGAHVWHGPYYVNNDTVGGPLKNGYQPKKTLMSEQCYWYEGRVICPSHPGVNIVVIQPA